MTFNPAMFYKFKSPCICTTSRTDQHTVTPRYLPRSHARCVPFQQAHGFPKRHDELGPCRPVFVFQTGHRLKSISLRCPPSEMGICSDLHESVPNLKCGVCVCQSMWMCARTRAQARCGHVANRLTNVRKNGAMASTGSHTSSCFTSLYTHTSILLIVETTILSS